MYICGRIGLYLNNVRSLIKILTPCDKILTPYKRLSRKRKPPTIRKACSKRFRTAEDKSAAESLSSLSSATPAIGKSTDELNVAETLKNLGKDAVTFSTNEYTESDNTAAEMVEDQLQGKKEPSTRTQDRNSQASYNLQRLFYLI